MFDDVIFNQDGVIKIEIRAKFFALIIRAKFFDLYNTKNC